MRNGSIRYVPSRKVPDGFQDAKKKLAFGSPECTAKPKARAPARADAENVSLQQPRCAAPAKSAQHQHQQPQRRPQERPVLVQQQRPNAYNKAGLVAARAALYAANLPVPQPQQPARAVARVPGYQHAHHHNASLVRPVSPTRPHQAPLAISA